MIQDHRIRREKLSGYKNKKFADMSELKVTNGLNITQCKISHVQKWVDREKASWKHKALYLESYIVKAGHF